MARLISKTLLISNLLRAYAPSAQPVRNIRGKAPEVARTLKQRLEDIARIEKDPELHYKVNIGLPQLKPSKSEEYDRRKLLLKTRKQSVGSAISVEEVKKEWLKTSAPFHIKAVAEHYQIFEDLFGEAYFVPRIPLDIQFQQPGGTSMPVYHGNQIKPSEANKAPTVKFEANPSSLWSLLLTNPDGHFTEPNSEYIHWFIANIPGNDLSRGDEIVSYLQPFPPRGTGCQRFIFILYKQDKTLDFSSFKKQSPCLELKERTFKTQEFYRQFQDTITPAGLYFFQSDWDTSLTDFYHNTLNMKEPVYDFDHPTPYRKPPIWFPHRQPFNLYMDKHRDQKEIAKELLLKRLKPVDPFKSKAPEPMFPNALPEDTRLPSWLRVEIRKQRLKWGRYSDM